MRCKGMKLNKERKLKNCGRPAKVFFRVQYSELDRYRDNGKHEDVFGFCEECAKSKDRSIRAWGDVSWRGDRKVLNLRGAIGQISPATESECAEEAGDKRLHDGKRELLRVMCTKGNSDLADRWEEVFKLALDEFHIRKVMGT
jgi:hypothetical protein